MDKISKLAVTLAIMGVISLLTAAAYWWQNPELTEMEVLHETWGTQLLGKVLLLAGFGVQKYKCRQKQT